MQRKAICKIFGTMVAGGLLAVGTVAHASVMVDFNGGASDFATNFTQNHDADPRTNIGFGATSGIQDQAGPSNGGGLTATGATIDTTVIYAPVKAQITDGLTHSTSAFVTAVSGLTSGDKHLQIGFIIGANSSFNGENPGDATNVNVQPTAFISARLLGDNHVEFQSKNIGGGTASAGNIAPSGVIGIGDWLKVTFTETETSVGTGAFNWSFLMEDYGPNGTSAPVTESTGSGTATVSGLANVDAYTGMRTATPGGFTGTINFDNFAVTGATVAAPEPATIGLMGVGAVSMLLRRRR